MVRQRHVQGEGEGRAACCHQGEVPDDPGRGEVRGEPEGTGEMLHMAVGWNYSVDANERTALTRW